MANLNLFAGNHQIISNNYLFWKFLRKRQGSNYQIYFDTADIIDMLTGMQGLSNGYAFKWGLYEQPKQLVYAVAYQNWLGPITLLPPHLTELYDKINGNHFLFPEKLTDLEHSKKEFWSKYIPENVRHLIVNPQNDYLGIEVIEALMKTAPHIFQGVYLLQGSSFWKKRYKSLKERKLIQFDGTTYNVLEISKDPVFKSLQTLLNKERPYNTSNNYIDALALCLFDRKLQEHERNPKRNPLPIFYSDQDHLLNATEEVAKKEIKGRFPFSIETEDQKNTLLVRDANFFFLTGVLQGAELEDVQLFDRLNNCFNSLQRTEGKNNKLGDAKAKMGQEIEENAPLTLLLEFFKRWWHTLGIKELKEVFKKDYHLDPQQEEKLSKEINEYINQEQQRLKQDLGQRPQVLALLRTVWKELHKMEERLKKLYPENISIEAAHEFGSRFSFPKPVYEKIQRHFNRMMEAAYGGEDSDIDEVKTETVNYIFDALTAKHLKSTGEINEKLDNLAITIGILWLLEKHKLIDEISKVLVKLPALKLDKQDVYPSPAFAIMHAAALLVSEDPHIVSIQNIINCVEDKYSGAKGRKNYKVWMALSYVYFRLAIIQYPPLDQIPENLTEFERESKTRQAALSYLVKTVEFAEKSLLYLEIKIADGVGKEELHRWRRAYYYAINNIIYAKTIILTGNLNKELEEKVFQLEALNDNKLFHEHRYSDTLARYYYRIAHHSQSNQRQFNINQSKKFNERSLNSMGTAEKWAFESLRSAIERLDLEQV